MVGWLPTSDSKLLFVIGDPVSHSVSPAIHNRAIRRLGIDAVYLALRVKGEMLGFFISLCRLNRVLGFNVTIPHKIAVAGLVDRLDDSAELTGCVNTVRVTSGLLEGFNTDVAGVEKSLRNAGFKGGGVAAVIGAGGGARAAVLALLSMGCRVVVLNRSRGRALELEKHFLERGLRVETHGLDHARQVLKDADLVVNATPVGMGSSVETPFPAEFLRSGQTLLDMVYTPHPTRLVKEASEKGLNTVPGVEMLIHQAAESFEIWFGVKPPLEEMRDEALRRLRV
ncbi:MAG: shikimate dehydrogenase [Candidatus Brockarchaeota archaeon]|nr:shikimate dehydrogenase [Candidatus Brockarchaeota archaeon]